MDNSSLPVRASQRFISWLIITLLVWQPVAPAFAAAMTPTGPATMDQAANGVPVVNIATPNGAGISHNQFKDYNVGSEGVILNNATGRLTQTQLGGLIQNNPNLQAGREAKGIINEVTGGSRSQLQGYTEVGGKAANVIVANPYGITCNSCGFINTPNATLTTGKPQFDANGNLSSLDVTQGAITIEGKGLDASNSDALSLIARATEVNAAIHAKDLTVTVGANRVAANGTVTAISGTGAAPVVAVDTGALGGMYANRIRLVSSEKGVGVNLGNLNARQGDITLDASGKLSVKSSLASGSMTAKGDGVTLTGSHKSGSELNVSSTQDLAVQNATLGSDTSATLSSSGKLTVSGSALTATRDLTLNGNDALIVTGSALTAGTQAALSGQQLQLDAASRMDAANNIRLNGGDITSEAQITAGGDALIVGKKVNNSGQIAAKNGLNVQADTLANSGLLQGDSVALKGGAMENRGALQSAGALSLDAASLDQQGTLSAKGDTSVAVNGTLRNSGTLLSNGKLEINAGELVQNGTLSGDSSVTVNTGKLSTGKNSLTTSLGSADLNATQQADLNGQINAAGALAVSGQQLTTQADAQLQSGQDLTLQAGTASLNGTLASKGALSITGSHIATQKPAKLHSDRELTLRADDVQLDGSHSTPGAFSVTAQRVQHSGQSDANSITFNAPQSIANSGTLTADRIDLQGQALLNSGAMRASLLSLSGQHLTNGGLLQGRDELALHADRLDNLTSGTLYSARNLTLNIPSLTNSGLITTDASLTLAGGSLTNQGEINGLNLYSTYQALYNGAAGRLLADGQLSLAGQSVVNDGVLAAQTLSLTGDSLKNQGEIQGDNALTLNVAESRNNGTLHTGGMLDWQGAGLVNNGLISATALLLDLSREVNNTADGRAIASDTLTLRAPVLQNSGLLAASRLELLVPTITNSGTLQGTRTLSATGTRLTNQQNGILLSGGELTLDQATLNNAGLMQGTTLNLATGEWINSGNALGEQGITARVSGVLNNSGNVLSQQEMDVKAATLDNRGKLMAKVLALHGDLQNSGVIQGSSTLAWDGNTLTSNTGGQLTGGETLTLTGTTLDNQGQVQSRAVTVKAADWQNGGNVQALDSLYATVTGRLDNQGALLSQNLFELAAQQLFNEGQLAAKTLALNTPELTNAGILQGNDSLMLTTRDLRNSARGQLISGSDLRLDLNSLHNQGLLLTSGDLSLTGNRLINEGDMQSTGLNLQLADTLTNQGTLVAKNGATLSAKQFANSGTLAGQTMTLSGSDLRNSGLIQGNSGASATADSITNDAGGQWLSGGALTFTGTTLLNNGTWQGSSLDLTASRLDNSGVLNGSNGLTGTVAGVFTNRGVAQSGGAMTFTADNIINPGRMTGKTLALNAASLNNSGLWQGADSLILHGNSLSTAAASRTLSGGALTLDAGQLTTLGTLQGQQVEVTADSWSQGGSLLSLGALTANTSDTLINTGSLASKGDITVQAQSLDNRGQLLSEGGVTLNGQALKNSGSVQGNTLALHQNSINNQGTLTGLQSLTIAAQPLHAGRLLMALAAPQRELINGAGGALLSQGTLDINNGTVTNAGSWQGQTILLNAQSLTNSGAVQSAGAMQMSLAGNLTSTTGSKITAMGNAALNALALTNQGQWAAQNLTLTGGSFSNSGATSGVSGLTANLSGAFNQQPNATLLTGGALNLAASSVTNAGKIQGRTLGVTTGALANSGRLQGDTGTTLITSATLSNNAGAEIVSGQALTLSTPTLLNYGLLQGGGETQITATSQAQNEGKLLSGARMTLNTPQFSGAGWLQSTNLILNAANATNNGTWIADQATLTGNTFASLGTTQAGDLTVNYQQLNNSGTLLGNNQLTVNASQVTQQAVGKLFSGGDLWLGSAGFDALGQVVALGNLTLQLGNAFTTRTAMAAGNTLSISSNGAIVNQHVLQGRAVNVSAGGQFINNGQITTGDGASTLSGSTIALNAAGTIQGGGDITLASRGNINVDGFTGTRGTLTLSSPGAIINTALLYAANNMALYADAITNQRGDILAGNSLTMQRDAAGNKNSSVTNTSGTIETQNGDITINTGNLLNTRDGFTSDVREQKFVEDDAALPVLNLDEFDKTKLEYGTYERCSGGRNEHCYDYIIFRLKDPFYDIKQVISEKEVLASALAGAARISSGNNLSISATRLDNIASNILVNKSAYFTGGILNNATTVTGKTTVYLVNTWKSVCDDTCSQIRDWYDIPAYISISSLRKNKRPGGIAVKYIPPQAPITETTEGVTYRAVIQAGGTVTANFTDNISNTSTTANAGGVTGTLSAPSLNTLSNQGIGGSVQKQGLATADVVAVNSPAWNDQIQGVLQQLNGGSALDANGTANAALTTVSTTQKDKANLGNTTGLANAGVTTAALSNVSGGALGQYQGKAVDTSAYPLPTGNNGYFVAATNPKSPYLITVNPKLDGLGQLDPTLFGDLNHMLGIRPGSAPQETRASYTNEQQFLGSSYMLSRLALNPDYDYRFLGDAAFDTRYVSNTLLNQTGNRYLNGIGSDLEQMRYLMDHAADEAQSLGLKFGVSLTADQIAALDHSIVWWEAATINGETVMVPKLYLSPKDVTVNNGSVIAGNNVILNGGSVTNSGSSLLAKNNLTINSQNSIDNLNDGLIKAGGNLDLSAIGNINNISSTIGGKTVQLESLDGDINNITLADQFTLNTKNKYGTVSLKDTTLGSTASITAQDGLSLLAGNNITLTGATLAAGGDLLMNAWGDIAVNANQINDAYSQSGFAGKKKTSSASVSYQGSSISAGGNLAMQAGHDLTLSASDVNAGGNAALKAGNDLNLSAEQTSQNNGKGKSESHSTGLDRTTVTAGNNLTLIAGQDINSDAAALAAEKNVGLQAGRDVNLLADETTQSDSYRSKNKTVINEAVRQQGTEIASGTSTVIVAGRDVNTEAAQVTAQDNIGVAAGRDVNLNTATESDYYYKEQTKKSGGFLSKSTTHTIKEESATREAGTLLSGDNVKVSAGNDLLVKGSAVVGDGDVALSARHNVSIEAATNTDASWQLKEKKKSGLMGSGGIGFTIGSTKSKQELKEKGTTQSESASTVGSNSGDVTITAGNQLHVGGSDLIAAKDMALTGDSVVIDPGHDKRTSDQKFEQKSSGLTVALTGAVVDAVNNAVTAAKSANEQSDSRLAALQATKSVLSGYQAVQGKELADVSGEPDAGIKISVSLSTQKSKSEQHQTSDTVSGSTLNAGNNLSITATGKNQATGSGDVVIAGSSVKAGGDTSIDAANDILLTGAANTQKTTGSNSSSGGGVGVSFGADEKGYGLSVFANVNAAKGHEKGDGTSWTETTVDSGGKVLLHSGQDTTLTGAQVNGNQVTADVGRNLTITSLQDSNNYDSKQSSVSAGGSFTFGSMTGSGYINASQDKMHSTFDSVAEQSGIFAGNGGFDVTVGNHTQLNGGAIGSTATADKNQLDTGTLGYKDIKNEADYKVSHTGIGISSSGSVGGQFAGNMASSMLAGTSGSGHAEGTTQAAVSQGTITIRDRENQQQDVGGLQRDVSQANDAISPIFDKEKEQNRLAAVQMIGEIGSQVADIARTQGELDGLKAARAAHPNMSVKDLKKTPEYQGTQNKYGTGSDFQRGIQAATAGLQGLAGGNIAGALAGASAPELAHIIGHESGLSSDAALVAHAILGGVAATLQGNSAAAGAAGAVSGELAAKAIAARLYPHAKEMSDLNEEEKQTVSMLATMSAGLAGGLAGDSTVSAGTGALAGKNAVENNHLSSDKQKSRSEELAACGGDSSCKASVREHYAKEYDKVQAQINTCSTAAECVAVAKEMKQWQAESSAKSDELAAKARNEGMDSLTPAEKQEWVNLRGAQSNFDGSINTLIYRAQMFGGSEETTTELANIFGHAAIANAAGAAAGISKAGKGSPLPTPVATVASNGLTYKSNPKHTAGQFGNRPDAGIEPQDSLKLFEQSVSSSKQYSNKEVRFAVDNNGNVHRFEGTNGEYHWNGSSGDTKNPLTGKQIPSDVQKQLGVKIK
jgi:filamentous hemagglutinin